MAHTTGVDIEKLCERAQGCLTPDQVTEPGHVITIEVRGGCVIDVRGLPDGCDYNVLDHDVDPEPEPEALYLATVNVLVRAMSPGRAADAVARTLDYSCDMDDGIIGTLIDWDYAVQDGERQYPKCVSLDLEPGNITELLDRIAQ